MDGIGRTQGVVMNQLASPAGEIGIDLDHDEILPTLVEARPHRMKLGARESLLAGVPSEGCLALDVRYA